MNLSGHLNEVDAEIGQAIADENRHQQEKLRLIPSENYAFPACMEACGTALNNKYSEGYAGRRYYQGQENIDVIETLAVERIKKLFGVEHANVQPYSGSPANLAVYFAFCNPGDTIMGMGLTSGGHLTHGWNVSISGKYFRSIQYGVRKDDQRIDFDEVSRLARENKPKLIFCGATAYPRIIDFSKFAEIANDVGAILVADISHISGLVAGGAHPTPVGHAPIVSSTTHKTLRGPRGGMIMCTAQHKAAIDKAVFPGLQGGPHNGTTAAIAIAAKLAATDEFKKYAHAIVDNSKALAERLMHHGFALTTGGSENHLILIDLTNKDVPGKKAAQALDRAGIIANYNSVPFDTRKPFDPSGVRLGTPAITARGMGKSEMQKLGDWIARVVSDVENEGTLSQIAGEIRDLCKSFPAPGIPT